MEMRLYRYDLPLRHTFTISRGSIDVQPSLIVELRQDGKQGFGEATSNDYYGFTIENMAAALESVRPKVRSYELGDPAEFWNAIQPHLAENPFAHCALDQAAYDLWGKLHGQPTYSLLGFRVDETPLTNYTIGIDDIDVMVEKLNEFPGWPVYKIKLGTDRDLEIVSRLRQATDSAFRIDANCGWTVEQCLSYAPELERLGVEFIEQPLPADRWDDMRELYEKSPLPLIADESCIVEADVARCAGHFHGVNVKLVKCGGITPGRRMLEEARQLGMRTMVGCMTESTVGISAIAQLLPLLNYVDMDGALLLKEDIARGVRIDNGRCKFPATAGNGVELTADGERLDG